MCLSRTVVTSAALTVILYCPVAPEASASARTTAVMAASSLAEPTAESPYQSGYTDGYAAGDEHVRQYCDATFGMPPPWQGDREGAYWKGYWDGWSDGGNAGQQKYCHAP
jgi:hypothetical protein